MPDDDELDAIESIPAAALVNPSGAAAVGSVDPIADAELVEPEPDRTDSSASLNAERDNNAGRRTYTLRDFER